MSDPEPYLEEAEGRIKAARTLLHGEFYSDAVSRAYYSIYNAAKAALHSRNKDAKTHSGLISLFSQEFVKTGEIEVEAGKAISHVEEQREKADYEPLIHASKEDAEDAIQKAERFPEAVKQALKEEKK